MRLSDKRGIVLVTGLLILAILSLLGAGSILSSTMDTSTVGNQKSGKQAFYAAEAARNAAILQIMDSYNSTGNFIPPDPADPPVDVTTGAHGFDGSNFNGYALTYRVSWTPQPVGIDQTANVSFPTNENGMVMDNMARQYEIEAFATGVNTTDSATVRETIRVLTRPLTQYLAFYEGHMNWRPQAAAQLTVNGGRVHANGRIYLAPQNGILFGFDQNRGSNALTATGSVEYHMAIQQDNSDSAAGGGTLEITVPVIGEKAIAQSITRLNRGQYENEFMVETDSALRVGVDRLRAPGSGILDRGGIFELRADKDASVPADPLVDTFQINDDGGALNVLFSVNGSVPVSFANEVEGYLDSTGALMALNTWDEARVNPDESGIDANFVARTIIYSKEHQPLEDHTLPIHVTYLDDAGILMNKDYPTILEANDPRETKPVEFIVIDLQRLQHWYEDYLVSMGLNLTGRSLLIYAAKTPNAFSISAIKIIGSQGGRVRTDTADIQGNATLKVPTIIATPNPVYVEGDFNSVGSQPCVIVADAVTFISNSWGELHYPPAVAGVTNASQTRYNAAIIAGRYDYMTGGSATEAEGVEDLPRKIENWAGIDLTFTGSLASPWFSEIADFPFNPAMVTSPNYIITYDTSLKTLPGMGIGPYVPSIHTVERESWREE
ncbi:hypothetical protein EPN96_07810 [bacterium]|nr:MAG: hypothetical protein EPN96_07810 [bacterium]